VGIEAATGGGLGAVTRAPLMDATPVVRHGQFTIAPLGTVKVWR
jgi:hypothetical protein